MNVARSTLYAEQTPAGDDTAVVGDLQDLRRVRTLRMAPRPCGPSTPGMVVNHKKVRRLMREQGLQPKTRRRHTTTTDSDHDQPIFPNLSKDLKLDAGEINVETEAEDDESVLHFYRKLIGLRKIHPVLVYGTYDYVGSLNPSVFGYKRSMAASACLVLMNFSQTAIDYKLPFSINVRECLLSRGAMNDRFVSSSAMIYLPGWRSLVLSVDS